MMRKLTEMSRTRFRELMASIANDSISEKWHDGKVAITKSEKVEERQIRAICMIYDGEKERRKLRELLRSDTWDSLELLLDEKNDKVRIHVIGRVRRYGYA